MSNGNRGFFTEFDLICGAILSAVVIGIFTWPVSPTLTDYGKAYPRNSDYSAGGGECEPAVLATIGDSGERLRRTDACAKEAEDYRQQTNDLIQQTRAADAAQAQAHIASQQLLAGWFQTIGGFLTLCAAVAAAIYARGAAKEGKRSADLADTQLSETRDVTAAQLRPYVAITESGESDGKPFNRESVITFAIKNFGQIPATNVRLTIASDIVAEPIGRYEVPLAENYGEYGPLAPGDHRTENVPATDLRHEELAQLVTSNRKFICRLRVDYEWPNGTDCHDITLILDDPATSKWYALDKRRRGIA